MLLLHARVHNVMSSCYVVIAHGLLLVFSVSDSQLLPHQILTQYLQKIAELDLFFVFSKFIKFMTVAAIINWLTVSWVQVF